MLKVFVPDIDCLKGLAWIGNGGLGSGEPSPSKRLPRNFFQGNLDVLLDCRGVQSQQDIPGLVALLPGLLG